MSESKEPEVLNPRYRGATPQMVAMALLRHKKKPERKVDKDQESKPTQADLPSESPAA